MGLDVAEVAAVLGLSIKAEEWDHALELIEKVKTATKGIGEVGKKAGEEAAAGFEKFRESAEMVEKFLEAYVGYEGVKSIAELTEHVVSQTMNLQHLSERYGTSIKTLQGFDYMARLTGASLQSVTYAMQRMEFGLHGVSALAGRRGAAGALAQMGISLDAFRKADMQGQLSMLADKFSKMADPNQKIAMALQLGGRGMVDLIPLLNRGSAAMAELSEEADEMGETLDPKKAEEYEEEQAKLQLRWDGLKTQIVKLLMPALQSMQKALEAVMRYFQEHPVALHAALIAIGGAAAFVGVTLSVLSAKAALASLGLKKLSVTGGGLVGQILALVAAVTWVNERFGHTPAVLTAVIGGLITLRTVLRSFKAEKLLSQFTGMNGGLGKLGGVAKGLAKALGGGEAAEGGALAEGAAEGGVLAEGGAAAAGLSAGAIALAALPVGLTALAAYKAYQDASVPEHYVVQDSPEARAMVARAYAASRGDVHITAPVQIRTEATAEDVARAVETHLQDQIRQAHKNMGGH